MIKKILSIVLIVLSVCSVINLNAKSKKTNPYECWDIADSTLKAYKKANLKFKRIDTVEDEDSVWNAAYDACMN